MSRNHARAPQPVSFQTRPFESEATTKPLPKVTLFDLLAEARRIDAEVRALDEDATVSIGPEENHRLVAAALALEEQRAPAPSALPTPPSPPARGSGRMRAYVGIAPHPPALRTRRNTEPPALAPAVSGVHVRVPEQPQAITTRSATQRAHRWLPEVPTETFVVAGIWATALSLIIYLLCMITST